MGPRARAVIVEFLRSVNSPPSSVNGIDPTNEKIQLVPMTASKDAASERDQRLAGHVVAHSAPNFSPRDAREERFQHYRANRKTKVQPSQVSRRKVKPKVAPADRYSTTTYAHAIRKAARKAGVPHWHPNQLRHLFATEIRKAHGLEAAQVLLGHSRADVTQIYAERNLDLAVKVASEVG
jgi:integrase